jgi:hypothetical protein
MIDGEEIEMRVPTAHATRLAITIMGHALSLPLLAAVGVVGLLACLAAIILARFVALAVGELVFVLGLLATATVYIRYRLPPPLVTKTSSLRLSKDMKTALFTFPDDKVRDKFFQLLKAASDTMVSAEAVARDPTALADGSVIKDALKTVKLDPPLKADHERVVALFVGGRKMREGSMAELNKQFLQEVESHKASVELKELRDGEWVSIRSRKLQRQQA